MNDWIGPLFKREEPEEPQELPSDETNGETPIEAPVKKSNGDSNKDDDGKKTLYVDEEVLIENE